MSEDQDPATKTEEPTPKRLSESQRKGQVAKSQEVNHWFMVFGATIVFVIFGRGLLTEVRFAALPFIETPHLIATDPGHLMVVLRNMLRLLLLTLAPIFGVLVIAAIAANVVQHKPVFTGERIKPKLNKLSPIKGFKRLFSMRSVVEFIKSFLKILLIASVIGFLVLPDRDILTQLVTVEAVEILQIIEREALVMLVAVVAIMAIIAVADMLYQKYEFIKSLRMSKQEIKDEQKQGKAIR